MLRQPLNLPVKQVSMEPAIA
jgi:hypothetical protein